MNVRKIFSIILFLIVVPCGAPAAYWQGQTHSTISAGTFTAAWQSLEISSGGLLNSVQISPSDGTAITTANTYGAYLYKATGTCAGADNGGWGTDYPAPCWEQLFTQTSAPLTLAQIGSGDQGVLEADSCNNNTGDAYAWYNGRLWVTTNLKAAASSRVWAQTPLTNSINGNQGVSAGTARSIGCDPVNPNVVYAANLTALNLSVNGLSGASATFSAVSTLPATGAIPDLIGFDPGSSTTTCGGQTCTAHIFVFVRGTGFEESYTGGASFTGASCGGTAGAQMKVDRNDQVWIVSNDTHAYKYVPNGTAGGGTCTTYTPGQYNGATEIAIDQSSASLGATRVVVAGSDGNISISTNNGSTWSGVGAMHTAATGAQPGWMGIANQTAAGVLFLTSQDISFDNSGNLFSAAGIGIWNIASASVANNATWQANSIGIEQLVANQVISPPGNADIAAVWDRGFFRLANADTFPSTYWPGALTSNGFGSIGPIMGGWAVDYASTNPNFIAGWVSGNGVAPATSSDGGNSYTSMSAAPSPNMTGGIFSAASTTNFLMVAGSSEALNYTTNAGATWTPLTISGAHTPLLGAFWDRQPIAADRVTANYYCLVDVGTGTSGSQQIYTSSTSTPSFTKQAGATVDGVPFIDHIVAVPGQAGNFFYSPGDNGTGYHLWKSVNGCVSFTQLTPINVYDVGFGAPKPGNTYPTVYCYCSVSGTQGVYESDDGGSTWALISAPSSAQIWPNNSSDQIKTMTGDMDFYGRVKVGFNGSGFAYIDTANACPWVGWSNQLPGASLTGTVSLQAQTSGLATATISDVKFYVDGTLIGTQTSYTGGGTPQTPRTYTQSWVSGGVATGAHTLTVATDGNSCTANTASDGFSIPITTH